MKSFLLSVSLLSLCSWLGWSAYEESRRPMPSVENIARSSGASLKPSGEKSSKQATSLVFPDLDTMDEIISRPLFNESRRPVTVEKIVPVAKPTDLNVMLSGIVIGQTQQIAHLRSLSDKETLALSVGDKIDGWEIQSIFADHVVLRSGGRVETLYMQKPGVKNTNTRRPSTKRPSAAAQRSATQRAKSRAKRNARRNRNLRRLKRRNQQ